MPMNRTLYPTGWEAFSIEIRAGRAIHRCECKGQCGTSHQKDTFGRCPEVNHQPGRNQRGRVILTTAHLCDCYPICKRADHVLAMCQRCHLRLDMARHTASRLRTQATPSYKAQRYRQKAKELQFMDLAGMSRIPKRKRNQFWFPPPPTPRQ